MISYPSSRHVSSSARHVSSYHILPTCHTSILTWRSSYQRSSSYRSSYQSQIDIDDDRHIISTSMIWRSWHVHLWVMSYISTSHVPHINVDMIWRSSHISTSHGTCIYESCHTYQRVMSHVSTIDDMTLIWRVVMIPRSYHNNDSWSTIIGHIDYHRSIVDMAIVMSKQVSFAKEPYKRDNILQKRLIISRRLLIVATPYGVASISRLLKIISLFCKRAL